MKAGDPVKIRLSDGRVVTAEYVQPAANTRKAHHVLFEGEEYFCDSYKPESKFEWMARFVWSPECKI